jgi:hypothetical protein
MLVTGVGTGELGVATWFGHGNLSGSSTDNKLLLLFHYRIIKR